MTNKGRNLIGMVADTAGFGAVIHLLYSGKTALEGSETFLEALTDRNTLYFSLMAMAGRVIYREGKRFYQLRREAPARGDR